MKKVNKKDKDKIRRKDFYAIAFFFVGHAWMLKSVSLLSIANNNFKLWGMISLIIAFLIGIMIKKFDGDKK